MQIIAGILPCIGLVGTAFSTQAWHALISNGIITGKIYYRYSTHNLNCVHLHVYCKLLLERFDEFMVDTVLKPGL